MAHSLASPAAGPSGTTAHRVAAGSPVYGVSVHRSLLDADVVAELHRHVEVVMTWPVNDVPSLDAMLDIGVTGIISDEQHVLTELKTRQHG